MRLQAALEGRLEDQMQAELDEGKRAVTVSVREVTRWGQARLREQVMSTMGSTKLANAWRMATDPRPGVTSLGAAGRIWSNAPHIVEAFSRARVVRSPDGFFLAIPTPDAPRLHGGRRVDPDNWPEARFGPLRFVYRRGQASLLVVDAVTRTSSGRVGRRLANDGMTKTGKWRRGASTVIMFFLVPFVRLPKMWDPQSVFDALPGRLADAILANWRER